MSNSFSPLYVLMLKLLYVYILVTVSISWMIFYALLELKFSDVRKVILYDFILFLMQEWNSVDIKEIYVWFDVFII